MRWWRAAWRACAPQVAPYAGASQAAELKASPPDLNAPVRKTIRCGGRRQSMLAWTAVPGCVRRW